MSNGSNIQVFLFSLLFVFFHALQFPIFIFVFKKLPKVLDKFCLRAAFSWSLVESLPIRIFPWHIGDTQIAFPLFAQIAELGGVAVISFMIFWVCESLYLGLSKKRTISILYIPVSCFILSLVFGIYQIRYFDNLPSNILSVKLVQSKAGTPEIGDYISPEKRIEMFVSLTERDNKNVDLVIWPETALPQKINESVSDRKNDPFLPIFSKPTTLLTGTQTFRRPVKLFNSAMLINSDDSIPLPYNKQILIPFGEYIPFEKYLPFLKLVNPLSERLSTGNKSTIFEISKISSNIKVKISPLICYEDIIPKLSSRAVEDGAQILVSISNDVWLHSWGEIGLYQHNMIASFRSIENRRPLVRVGSTGLTTYIDSTGKQIASIPPRTEDTLSVNIPIIGYQTLYSKIHYFSY